MAKKAPSDGDRIDLGGKLPQFDEFAWLAYKELTYNNLDWIRIADPKALKLDDILYSTKKEIHAYQVKWSNQEKPPAFSFKDFLELFPEFSEGWDALKKDHSSEDKRIIIHLLTNRPLSKHDSVKVGNTKLGSFNDFVREVWNRIRIGKAYPKKWKAKVEELCAIIDKTEPEFIDLCRHFEIQDSYEPKGFKSDEIGREKQSEDLLKFSRFLFETVVDKKKKVKFSSSVLIESLGWAQRFKTRFQHDLIIDRNKYQPIKSSIDELDQKITATRRGYFFLTGGPGTGKSTLLTQWSKTREERVIKYYAFDFKNPAQNYSQRGESQSLYFDLVVQLRNSGIGKRDTLPHDDLIYLREVFFQQLQELNADYKETKKRTIIIIDGLDHVPREYASVKQSFLRDLPPPDSIPEGVQIVLGSQSFELADLSPDITREWKKLERSVAITSLTKGAVFKYILNSGLAHRLSEDQKQSVFEKSQGHPLYLSYLTEKLLTSEEPGTTLNQFSAIDGDIDSYYRKLWKEIKRRAQLIEFLGLLSRIQGNINPSFIDEWGINEQTLIDFNDQARHLLDQSIGRWAFFHNSFRQFLVQETAMSLVSGSFNKKKDIGYHMSIVTLYNKSKLEPSWNSLYHLFIVGQFEEENKAGSSEAFDEFVKLATPESFVEQFKNYRPAHKIREDINLGVQISLLRKDVYLLTRFMFCAAELERKMFHFDPVGLTKEFLSLGKVNTAKDYLRQDSALLCDKKYALEASRLFHDHGDKVEAKILFSLAEPDNIAGNSISIDSGHSYLEERKLLEQWIYTASLFHEPEFILEFVENLEIQISEHSHSEESEQSLRQRLFYSLAEALIGQHKWNEVVELLDQFNKEKHGRYYFFLTLRYCIEECLEFGEKGRAQFFLELLLDRLDLKSASPRGKVLIANLIYKVTSDTLLVGDWIEGVEQPKSPSEIDLSHGDELDHFEHRIVLNKLLKLSGKQQSILDAVKSPENPEDIWIVEFERKLCLIAELLADGLLGIKDGIPILNRVKPIVQFYYRKSSHRERYWYNLTSKRGAYLDLLVYAVSNFGEHPLKEIAKYLFSEFQRVPEFWPNSVRRKVILALSENGLEKSLISKQLFLLEPNMKEGLDVSGRIDVCMDQMEAWLRLGENGKAQHWIQEAIDESLGVGYSKDYQFNTWIEWLEMINKHDPENALGRIRWFLSHLQHIEDTTEVGLETSNKMLRLTLKFNYSYGIELLNWQLSKGLIHFESAFGVLLEEHLEAGYDYDVAYLLYTEFFVLFAKGSWIDLLNLLLKTGFSKNPDRFTKDYLLGLVQSVKIRTLEERRSSLLDTIREFAAGNKIDLTNLVPADSVNKKKGNYSSSSNKLTILPSHEEISEKDVLKQVNGFADFKELLDQEDPENSWFYWDKVIDKVAPQLSLKELEELSDAYRVSRKSSAFYSKLSKLAFELGGTELATYLGEQALEYSSSAGWTKFYDGGTRVMAFEALQMVSKEKYTDKAFEAFSSDLISSDYPSSYIEQLDEILPLITLEFDARRAWNEVDGYLQRLMLSSKQIPDTPDFSTQVNPVSAVLKFILDLASHPVNLVSERARLVLVLLLKRNDHNKVIELIKGLSNGNAYDKELLFIFLCMIKFSCPDKIMNFEDELKTHQASEDYFVRTTATTFLREFFPTYSFKPPQKRLPSAIYNLHFKPIEKPFGNEMEPFDFVKDTSNLRQLVGPFSLWIRILSEKTGIDESNLLYRINEIIRKHDDPKRLTSKFEEDIREKLDAVNLKYSYPRPRFLTVRKAILYLITELIDSELLQDDYIFRSFDIQDFQLSFLDEVERPDFIHPLSQGEYSSVGSEWVSEIDNSHWLKEIGIREYKDDWLVIGEYSMVRSLHWGTATETFMFQLLVDEEKDQDDLYQIFGSTFQKTIQDYDRLKKTVSRPYLILVNDHRFNRFDIKSHWIAFNPVFAHHLGWLPGEEPLSWVDSNDQPVAKSIFWSSGNIDMRPPHLHSEAGEGWLVLVTKAGLNQIEEIEEKLIVEKKVIRRNRPDRIEEEDERILREPYK